MDIKQIKECPDCASINIVKSAMREQVICRDCGLIQPITPPLPAKKAKKPVKKPKKKAVKKAKKRKK